MPLQKGLWYDIGNLIHPHINKFMHWESMPLTPNKMIFQDLQRLVNNHFGFINGTHKLSLQSEESHLNFHKRTEKSADRPNDRLKIECRKNLFLLISVPYTSVIPTTLYSTHRSLTLWSRRMFSGFKSLSEKRKYIQLSTKHFYQRIYQHTLKASHHLNHLT